MEDQDGSVELVQHLRNIRGRVQQLPGGGEARLTVVDSRVPDHHLALVVKLEGPFGDAGGGRDRQAAEKLAIARPAMRYSRSITSLGGLFEISHMGAIRITPAQEAFSRMCSEIATAPPSDLGTGTRCCLDAHQTNTRCGCPHSPPPQEIAAFLEVLPAPRPSRNVPARHPQAGRSSE